MRMLCRQELIPTKSIYSPTTPIQKKQTTSRQSIDEDCEVANQLENQTFDMSFGQTRKNFEASSRKIKRSVINRSCINVVSYCSRALLQIPAQLMRNGQMKMAGIQKLDLSFNNIWDIRKICFDQMSSLKQLILNDNKISQLPFAQLNNCKGLRLINLNNNQLYIMPALTKVSYLQAKNNPLNLITADLVKLSNLQFFSFDWLEYLIDSQTRQHQDNYKEYSLQYAAFKRNILERIDYKNQHNNNFCDFNCYFSVHFSNIAKEDPELTFLSQLIVRAISKNDTFFINYLKSFQNLINYAELKYRYKLLLQIVFQSNSGQALQLFCLRKSNYSETINDQCYFQSLKLCCSYSNYTMFRYLFEMKKRRKRVQTLTHLSMLILQILYKYNRQKESDKILFDLVGLYIDVTKLPIVVKIPHQFNSRIFKSLSLALLDIYQHQWLSHYFQIDFDNFRTTPLHFAMKSKNQELLKLLLNQSWNVFEKNQNGVSCKFTPGSTQVGRKMVWKHEKALIKKHFKQKATVQIGERIQKLPEEPRGSINKQVKSLIGYADLQQSFMMKLPLKQHIKYEDQTGSTNLVFMNRKDSLKDEIMNHLLFRAKQFSFLNWQQHYLRKMINIDVATFLIRKLSSIKENKIPKKIESGIKLTDSLIEVFQIVGKDNALIQFQAVQGVQWVNLSKDNAFTHQIQVQSDKKSIESNNFWCCQAVPYQ